MTAGWTVGGGNLVSVTRISVSFITQRRKASAVELLKFALHREEVLIQ